MLDRQRMIEREDRLVRDVREHEASRDKEVRGREDSRDEAMRNWQGTLHRREMVILGGMVTIAIALSTVFGGMIEAGWIPSPWGTTAPLVEVTVESFPGVVESTPTPSPESAPGTETAPPQEEP